MQTIPTGPRVDPRKSRSRVALPLHSVVGPSSAESRYVTQVLMHELDCDGAFADTGSDPLHRTVANVADREDARNIRLQQTGIALQRPAPWPLAGLKQIRTRQNEPAFVALNCSVQPGRPRLRADEYEQRMRRYLAHVSGKIAPERHRFQTIVAVHLGHARVAFDVNIGGL